MKGRGEAGGGGALVLLVVTPASGRDARSVPPRAGVGSSLGCGGVRGLPPLPLLGLFLEQPCARCKQRGELRWAAPERSVASRV